MWMIAYEVSLDAVDCQDFDYMMLNNYRLQPVTIRELFTRTSLRSHVYVRA